MQWILVALGQVFNWWLHLHGPDCIYTNCLDLQGNVGSVGYGLYLILHETKQL